MNTKAPTRRRWREPRLPFILKVIPWFIGVICVIANAIALISVAARSH